MKIADLEQIEQEVKDKGFRVRYRNGTEDYQYLPDLEENGAPDVHGAFEWEDRLSKIAAYKQFRDITVVGPDLEPPDFGPLHEAERGSILDSTTASAAAEGPQVSAAVPTRRFGATNANPNRMAGGVPLVGANNEVEAEPDPDARQAIDGIPLQGGTVLAEQDGLCLVGDGNAQVYVCPKEALEGRQDINWRPKVKRVENVIMGPGDDGRGGGAYVPWLNWTGQGMTARAAFHGASALWFVKR